MRELSDAALFFEAVNVKSSLSMARLSHRLDFCSMFELIPPVIVPDFPSRVPSRAITDGRKSGSS